MCFLVVVLSQNILQDSKCKNFILSAIYSKYLNTKYVGCVSIRKLSTNLGYVGRADETSVSGYRGDWIKSSTVPICFDTSSTLLQSTQLGNDYPT